MIYCIQADIGGPVKIGYTSGKVADRVKALQAGSPFKLQVLVAIEGTPAEEGELHKKFKIARLHGEWFEFTEEVIHWVRENQPHFDVPRRFAPPAFKAESPEAGLEAYSAVISAVSHRAVEENPALRSQVRARISEVRQAARAIENIYDTTCFGFDIEDPANTAEEALFELEAALIGFLPQSEQPEGDSDPMAPPAERKAA